jgi:hypothetical protein
MIKSLRKKHLQIWTALSILMPTGIFLAWLLMPDQPYVKILQPELKNKLSAMVRSVDKTAYHINLLSNPQKTAWQLQWTNKTALTVPSAVIYNTDGASFDVTRAILIGRIEARGEYIFPLNADTAGYKMLHLVLYDFIHQQTIDSINF